MLRITFATLVAFTLNILASNAQDTMFKMDGEQIEVKVLEITASEVKYKLTSNLDGPTYILPKAEVYMVEYANGSKEVFAVKPKPIEETPSPKVKSEKRTEDEKEYRSRKGGGIAAVVIGSIALVSATPVAVDGFIKLSNEQANAQQAIIGSMFSLFGIIGLAAGIDQLVKASALKIRLMNSTSALHIRPELMEPTAYNGPMIQRGSGVGLRFTYQF
jgi:hypothetical protein